MNRLERARALVAQKAAGDDGNLFIEFRLRPSDAEQLAIPNGEEADDLHVTLVYQPGLAGYEAAAREATARFARSHAPVSGRIGGVGRFAPNEDGTAVWAYFDAPLLPDFREDLMGALVEAGVPIRPSYGYLPHITLAYVKEGETPPTTAVPIINLTFDSIRLHFGRDVTTFPLNNTAPNYKVATDNRDCASCVFFSRGWCSEFNLMAEPFATCDRWAVRPQPVEVEEKVTTTSELFGYPGLDGRLQRAKELRRYNYPEILAKFFPGADGHWPTGSAPQALERAKALREKTTKRADGVARPLIKAKAMLEASLMNSFTVFKDANGRYRWVARSSNAFRDRDGEIVSTKALADDVVRADATKEYGPLRFWHMPGVDIGDCDFNWLRGRTLLESGTFRDEHIGARVAEKADQFQLSIGFRHPPNEPDSDGVFHSIRRFERSLVPAGRAANPFTSISVTKESAMSNLNDAEKLQALKSLLGNEALLQQALAGADTSEKTAVDMGVAFKDVNPANMTADQALEWAIARKEAELQAATKADDEKKEPPAKEDEEDMTTKMGGYMDRMEKCIGRMEGMMGGREKDDTAGAVTAVQEASVSQSERIKQLESQLAAQAATVAATQAALKELQGNVPAGVLNGVRPSQAESTIVPGQPNVEAALKEAQNDTDKFLSFAFGPNGQ